MAAGERFLPRCNTLSITSSSSSSSGDASNGGDSGGGNSGGDVSGGGDPVSARSAFLDSSSLSSTGVSSSSSSASAAVVPFDKLDVRWVLLVLLPANEAQEQRQVLACAEQGVTLVAAVDTSDEAE